MLESILSALGIVLAVIGLVAVIHFVLLHFIRPRKGELYFEVLVFDEKEENAGMRVSFLLSQLMSMGNLQSCRILAVDNGMTPGQKKSLMNAFGQEKSVIICSADEAVNILFGKKSV